ncbi:hypothetical protein CASFOL_033525 [Castilleja foliolosa]|uniref:Uncharacterized protein n=1 Tax=Castilleja foliolosa TaxID=1961234 RepID=A0ABD3BY10_9LAMI
MEAGGDEGKKDKIIAGNNNNEKSVKLALYEEAMKKCLQERRGDMSAMVNCKSIIEAFINKSSSSASSSLADKKPLAPLRLKNGCLTDV